MAKTTHIAVFTIPVFTHQASIIELCKRLHLHHHFHITCIFPTINSPILSTTMLLKSLPSTAISHIFLPPVNEQDLPHQDVSPQTKVQLAVSQSMQSFRDTLASLRASSTTPPLAALVVDAFANEALEIAKEFDLASYVYIVTSAMTLSLLLHLPTLHEEVACEYKDCVEGIRIPGCVSIQGRDLPDDFQDRSSFAYELILQRSKRFDLACGFLVNSFCEMEENVVTAFHEDGKGN